ncbi:hypothetical protein PTSG_08303 [Salpingoeca rosetta]|uniref:3-beta hydroxysteroid dehydrogenase/isomerase domain-containing protein n=1 Tax=Salpingoeca rosetta (strain ATCC 50818 / BSB-021) TaxID=946362 RepID=F2UJB2_SALR5|nr:uncharacterized protein PTSG_08303 [Salpingoeca rosetta]EGD77211.1 hypothetical protein PTSG_08303 [Salpingoeca rosetta]|eukprot:XP_004990555.1 hypothetical protein PTSG_08303 [Salpingoeca rosetta]
MTRSGGRIAVVTGAAGFLGSHLVEELLDDKDYVEVRILDLRPIDNEIIAGHKGREKLVSVTGSITDAACLTKAFADADVVFHVAALVDWGQRPAHVLHEVNVVGTQTVITACLEQHVPALVFTSTMDVVCWRGKHHRGVTDEQAKVPPTPSQFLYGAYATTKAQAEQEVLAVNGTQLRTCALRVTGMYGERDPYHLPNVMNAAKSGSLAVRLGSPDIVMTHIYVKNVAHAHVCAARELLRADPRCQGRAYLLSETTTAENFWEFFEEFVEAAGYRMPPAWPYIPAWLVILLAYINMALAWVLSPVVTYTPTLTPGAVTGILWSQWFIGTRAKPEFDFQPIITPEEGRARTKQAMLRDLDKSS